MTRGPVVASLALFVLLAIAFVYVLRRAARVVAVTREDETRSAATARRWPTEPWPPSPPGPSGSTASAAGSDAPSTLDEVLPQLARGPRRARRGGERAGPACRARDRSGARIVEEIDRAGRAVETVRHGCVLLGADARRAARSSRARRRSSAAT